ncbi:unnamed protein product, partial [Closterium sp. NIES-53]
GDCYLCVPPDPGIEAAALGAGETAALGASASAAPGAGESALSGTASAQVLHTFTLDSGASRSFFQDCTTLTPLSRPVAVSLADPSGGLVLASFSTVLPCPAAPSGSLSGLYLPSFSTNLVFAAASGSSLESAPCSCRLLSHQTLLWHHRLGHPSLPRLRGMASRVLVSGLPRSLPPLPPGPAPTCVPCVEGRQRAAPHSSEFPPTEAPLQTLHMDVWGPAHVRGQGHERYFLLVVDDYSHRGGEFSSTRLGAFCRAQGIRQTFTLPASPQQNGIAERRIGMVMDVAHTSMIHAAAPHFLWPFAVQYAAHQLTLQPRVSLPETSPTLLWTGKVDDASAFRVWGSRAFVRDLSADKLSPRATPCVFLGFPPDAPSRGLYHPTSRRQNGIAERRIGMVMDVAHTSMIHAAAPHFLWPFAVQYAAHQLTLQPRVSLPETSPTLLWTGKVGDASAFRVWESRAFVRDLSADKLSPRATPCVFLGFPPDAPGWQFYHPTSRRGPAPSGVSHVDAVEPVEEAVESGAATGAEPAGAGSGGAEPEGVEPGGAESWGTEPGGAGPGGAEPGVSCLFQFFIRSLRFILARELQQRGQLRLAYVASEANTADIFTKALPPGDHQRFCTMLGLLALLCLTGLATSCFPYVPTCFLVQSFLFLHTSAGPSLLAADGLTGALLAAGSLWGFDVVPATPTDGSLTVLAPPSIAV